MRDRKRSRWGKFLGTDQKKSAIYNKYGRSSLNAVCSCVARRCFSVQVLDRRKPGVNLYKRTRSNLANIEFITPHSKDISRSNLLCPSGLSTDMDKNKHFPIARSNNDAVCLMKERKLTGFRR